MYGGCLLCPLYPLLFPTDCATLLHHKIRTSSQLSVCLDPFRIDFVSSRIAPPPPLFLDILKIYLIQSYTIKILNSGLLTKKPFSSLVAWVAACPHTRLNHLHSPSALYTDVLDRLRRRQLIYLLSKRSTKIASLFIPLLNTRANDKVRSYFPALYQHSRHHKINLQRFSYD